uniref:Aldehyde dehydrogenase domain-containing protein n=1 Tax=Leptobrachium leishanense TaxID=445787 RepID=A0A8C5QN09_9ANUR
MDATSSSLAHAARPPASPQLLGGRRPALSLRIPGTGDMRARERWYAAFRADLGKPAMEVELTELLPVLGEAATPSPRGRCLIIGPWNYPLNTVLGPLVSAVAAGNTAIVIADVFEPTEVAVVEGGVATATRLLALPFDHIFFTGSPAVGQVVMAALGGKSPAIVDASADLPAAARMLAWGKLANAGQTCVAPDHVLVHRSVAARFAECWREAVARTTGAARTRWPPAPTSGHGEHAHAARVAELVDDALARGAVALGRRHARRGRALLRAHPAGRCAGRRPHRGRGDLRAGHAAAHLRHAGRGHRARQRRSQAPALYIFSRDREAIARVAARTSSGSLGVNLWRAAIRPCKPALRRP